MYTQVPDPQCYDRSVVKSTLQQLCVDTRKALALKSDPSVIVFQHPKPGVRGNFAPNQLTGPGRWGLDVAVSKNIEFMEGKSLNFRMDIQNIFNHPTPSGSQPGSYNQRDYSYSNPEFGINASNPFGYIGYKGGHRVFSAKIRVSF
jgi:hypothetical protein